MVSWNNSNDILISEQTTVWRESTTYKIYRQVLWIVPNYLLKIQFNVMKYQIDTYWGAFIFDFDKCRYLATHDELLERELIEKINLKDD
jgi:hypothetical protein